MREIVVISGKGGTGKSSICASFAHLMQNGIVCDLDVDTPDMHIILSPEPRAREEFISGHEAFIRQNDCSGCGLCLELCRFTGIRESEGAFFVDPLRCEGCGVCAALCPVSAIELTDKHSGDWYLGQSRFGPFLHARLRPGEENSGRLVTLLKQKAREYAKTHGLDTILCDGSPGVGCPVISSLSGARLAVAVVEPTPSGRHDFSRVADLCDHFRIPISVIINKADLNTVESAAIEALCASRGYAVAGRIPFSPDVTTAMVRKKAITETDTPLAAMLANAWEHICQRLASLPGKATL